MMDVIVLTRSQSFSSLLAKVRKKPEKYPNLLTVKMVVDPPSRADKRDGRGSRKHLEFFNWKDAAGRIGHDYSFLCHL